MSVGPFDLVQVRALYGSSGAVTPKPVSDNFYGELGRDFDASNGALLIAEHSFAETWPTWEIHPEGDELVYLIEGDTDFVLWAEDHESIVRVNVPGSYIIVPRDTWHTARPHKPCKMLFLTHGAGTVNALEPGGEPLNY